MTVFLSTPSAALVGAFLGLAFGSGIYLLVFMNPWSRPRNVEKRINPYVRRGHHAGLFAAYENAWVQHPFVQRNLAPVISTATAHVRRLIGDHDQIRRRLEHAGVDTAVSAYRLEQALWALGAFVLACTASLAVLSSREVALTPLILGCILAAILGALGRDYYLSTQVKRHTARLSREFPTVTDLLALAVAAGESPLAAMERVARTSRGAVARELGATVADVHSGFTVDAALVRLAERTPLESLSRFAEAVGVALERGTPLAEVLRAQAQDARDAATRDLMEEAGRREISMLIPVVFFIMPLVIVFAIFPGLAVLRIGI